MTLKREDIAAHFTRQFGAPAQWIVRAPGRVNLIGEHTDYNDGFVLPMAIDRAVWIALRPRNDRRVAVRSIDYNESAEFSLDDLVQQKAGWIEYIKGTAWALQDAGWGLVGWEGVIAGDVPLGAGLSSSAALEMAAARAIAAAANLSWNPAAMAKLCRRAENQWVGVNCGIMDQMISAAGQCGCAMLLDCRDLSFQPAPLPSGVVVVVLDTSTRRGLVDSAYNERRRQCEQAARFFRVKALRDVTMEEFQRRSGELDDATRRRARHVIGENDRTVAAAAAMGRGDVASLGKLMDQSHASLRDDYEVSSDALDAMVACAAAHPACFGARMTGAGFGGCAMAIVRADAADDFVQGTASAYHVRTGHAAAVYVCRATSGAAIVG